MLVPIHPKLGPFIGRDDGQFTYKSLINTLFPGQMFLLDRFFDGTFLTFGIEVLSFADRDQEDRIDPMVYIFPR